MLLGLPLLLAQPAPSPPVLVPMGSAVIRAWICRSKPNLQGSACGFPPVAPQRGSCVHPPSSDHGGLNKGVNNRSHRQGSELVAAVGSPFPGG